MKKLVTIVEGDGEVGAVPILLRRLAKMHQRYDVEILPPIRVRRDKFLRKDDEFSRMLRLADAKAQGGTILILLDADDDCPVALSREVQLRAANLIRTARLVVVFANREFESWLLAAAESIAGRRGLRTDLIAPSDVEQIRNAKGWLSEHIAQGRYHEVTDQPALTAVFDLDLALERSRSFRKLVKECARAFGLENNS